MPTGQEPDNQKLITGYCEPWSLRAGEEIKWFGSSHIATSGVLEVVRLDCGDPTRSGPGFAEQQVKEIGSLAVDLVEQPLIPGSYAEARLPAVTGSLEVSLWFQPTLLKRDGVLLSLSSGVDTIEVFNNGDTLMGSFGESEDRIRERPLERHRWYFLELNIDLHGLSVEVKVMSPETASPGRDLLQAGEDISKLEIPEFSFNELVFRLAAGTSNSRWDGRIAAPTIVADDRTYQWAFDDDMEGPTVRPTIGDVALELNQLPARGVTGPTWTGQHQRWSDNPSEWNAIHFHHDDLYDAAWEPTRKIRLPEGLDSGIYCFRFESELGLDRVPFFVRPAVGADCADVALLMPTCTYMAYANHRMLIEGADFVGARSNLRPEHQYLADHREVGLSHYEKHPDGSGVMFSSRRRPVLQLRPGADGWNFTPDTDIHAFLLQTEVGHDVISDEDLHDEGYSALAPYRVIVTGSHPDT